MCVVMLPLDPEVEAALAAIEIVTCGGTRETACERDGDPKVGYPSAACARRGVLLLSWRDGTPLTRADAVYQCAWCSLWHHTRRKWLLVSDETVLAA